MVAAVMSSMVASVAGPVQIVRGAPPPSLLGLLQYADPMQVSGLVQYTVGTQGTRAPPPSGMFGLPSWRFELTSLLLLLDELHAASHTNAAVPMNLTAKKIGFLNMDLSS
jgi:hypothetical protein